jgi:hypothetical protein
MVPEPAKYTPSSSKRIQPYYVGPLQWHDFNQVLPPWFDSICPDGKTIYLTFGGTGLNKSLLINIAKQLVNEGFRVCHGGH